MDPIDPGTLDMYRVEPRQLWGDYGDVLVNGMGSRGIDNNLNLTRTGPFIPEFYMPFGAMVIAERKRRAFEALGLPDVSLRPVNYDRIVQVPWETWNAYIDMPAVFPDSNEPEDYLNPEEWPTLDQAIVERSWEVIVPEVPLHPMEKAGRLMYVVPARIPLPPLFSAPRRFRFFVRDDWMHPLKELFQEWINITLEVI